MKRIILLLSFLLVPLISDASQNLTGNLTVTGNIGIGTTTSHAPLEVQSYFDGDNYYTPLMVSHSATGLGDLMIVNSSGNVGLGNVIPVSLLAVAGNASVGSAAGYKGLAAPSNGLIVQSSTGIGTFNPTAMLTVQGNSNVGIGPLQAFNSSRNLLLQINDAGSIGMHGGGSMGNFGVGIGTYVASAKLEIVSGGAGNYAPLMISSTPTGDGDYLLVDSVGNIGIGTTKTTLSALTVMTGNVGIGTWNPRNIMEIRAGSSAASDNAILFSNASVSHGFTTYAPADVFGRLSTYVGTGGGLKIEGFSEANQEGIILVGYDSAANPNQAQASVSIFGAKLSGTTGTQLANNETVFKIYNGPSTSGAPQPFTILGSMNVGIGTTIPAGALAVMNGNVGVGTWSPGKSLSVVGNIGIGTIGTSPYLTTAAPNGGMFVEGAVGIGTTLATATTGLSVMTGNVGIGTWSPATPFQVNNAASGFQVNSSGDIALLDGVAASITSSNLNLNKAGAVTLQNTSGTSSSMSINGGAGTTSSLSLFSTSSSPTNTTDFIKFIANGSTEAMRIQDNSGTVNIGIGTASPSSSLSVVGHIQTHGTAPTVANNDCGTTSQGTVVAKSTDVAGSMTVGTLAVTSCAMTFNSTWTNAPNCIVIDDSNILAVKASATTTKLTVASTTSMSGDVLSYICIGNE